MRRKNPKKKKHRLDVARVIDVPLRELSGVCLRRGARGVMSVFAIGDRASMAVWARLPRDDSKRFDWRSISIGRLAGSRLPRRDPQIEALCIDGAGRVLLLQESPPRAEFVDLETSNVVASIDLDIPGRDELARSWADPEGSRGEGAVFLRGGHLLVAKEKRPATLIEFGPAGARSGGFGPGSALRPGEKWGIAPGHHRYVALAVWRPDKKLAKTCADFSDLEVGPDGRLYLLSDQSAAIARLDDLPPGGGTAARTAKWKIRNIDGKPEGLTFTANGRAIVALDTRKARNNLILLEPAVATR